MGVIPTISFGIGMFIRYNFAELEVEKILPDLLHPDTLHPGPPYPLFDAKIRSIKRIILVPL